MFQHPASNSALNILVSISNIIMPKYKYIMAVKPCFLTFKAFRLSKYLPLMVQLPVSISKGHILVRTSYIIMPKL